MGKINAHNINSFGGNGCLGGLVEVEEEAGKGAALGGAVNTSTWMNTHLYSQYPNRGQEEMDYMGAGMMTGQEHRFSQYMAGAFDGMALSDQFLEEYYSSVSTKNVIKNGSLTHF